MTATTFNRRLKPTSLIFHDETGGSSSGCGAGPALDHVGPRGFGREDPARVRAAGAGDPSELPKGLPVVEEWGDVTETEAAGGFLSVVAMTETGIIELYPVMARAVSESGHTILAGDHEGSGAEISFERGEGTAGTFRLREGPCAEQATIGLLYEAERYRRNG